MSSSRLFQFSTFKLSKRAITASMMALSRSTIAIASVIFAFCSLDGTSMLPPASDDRGDALDSDLPWPFVWVRSSDSGVSFRKASACAKSSWASCLTCCRQKMS
jgi:hypothetical protein